MNTVPTIRVGIVEDDPHIQAFLVDSLTREPDLSIGFVASTLAQALAALRGPLVDVLLLDLGLPDGSGVELIAKVSQIWPQCEVLVSTQFGDEASVIASFEAGATGYLLKQQGATQIASDIRMLHGGGSPISPLIARKVLHKLHPAVERRTPVELSARELQALELSAKGFTADEIAQLMSVSRNTVLTYVRRTYRKLNVNSKAEAIFEARQEGLMR
jgi:DNA-binding NarL/FixJ family response regulator